MPFQSISVIGLSYIGLPPAAVFASRKKRVIGVDVNQKTIATFFIASRPSEQVLQMNGSKPAWVLDKVKLAVVEFLQANPEKTANDVTIARFGLAFKQDIDNLRESSELTITQQTAASHPGPILAAGLNIEELPSKLNLVILEAAQSKADVILLLVDHKELKTMSKTAINQKALVYTHCVIAVVLKKC